MPSQPSTHTTALWQHVHPTSCVQTCVGCERVQWTLSIRRAAPVAAVWVAERRGAWTHRHHRDLEHLADHESMILREPARRVDKSNASVAAAQMR